jgi:hypothetical protein
LVAVAGAFYQVQRVRALKDLLEETEEVGTTDVFLDGLNPIDRQVGGVMVIFRVQASARMVWAARSQVSL